MSARIATIADAFEFVRNGKSIKQDPGAGGLPITRIETISNWTVDPGKVGFAGLLEKGNEKWLLRNGDILFSHINSPDHIGKCALYEGVPQKLVHGMNLLTLRPKAPLLDAKYAVRVLSSPQFRSSLQPFVNKAVNQASISTTNLKSLQIPLPPLDEQRRIAAILDKADALRRKRKRALEMLDGLTQSIFLEMFGTPSHNQHGFRLGKIGDLLESTQYGTSAKAGSAGAYPILRMGNITDKGQIDFSDLKYIDLLDKDALRYTVRKGDILFNRTNSADLVGKTGIFPRDEPFAFAGYLVRARVKKGIAPEYVAGYLNSPHGKATLRSIAKSIVGMANINAQEMRNIPILIPPVPEQQKFQDRLRAMGAHRSRTVAAQERDNALFTSLQHRAFTGQL